MCRLQIINCGNVSSCSEPCAIGVVFCDPLITSHNGQTTEYYLMKKFRVRDRKGCDGHNFFPTTASAHHKCSACEPESFEMLDKNLTASNGDLVGALVGALNDIAESSSQDTGSEEDSEEDSEEEASDESESEDEEEKQSPSDDPKTQPEDSRSFDPMDIDSESE